MALDVKDVKDMYIAALEGNQKRWKRMLMCYDFMLGGDKQWSKAQIDHFTKYDIFRRTVNLTHQPMHTIKGMFIQQGMRPEAFPVEHSDYAGAADITQVLLHNHEICDFDYHWVNFLMDGMASSWAHAYLAWRPHRRFKDGVFRFERIHPFDAIMDVNDQSPDIDDDRFRGRAPQGTPEYIANTYGWYEEGLEQEIKTRAKMLFEDQPLRPGFMSAMKDTMRNVRQLIGGYRDRTSGVVSDYVDYGIRMLRILEFDYVEEVRRWMIVDPMAGEPHDIPDKYQNWKNNQDSRLAIGEGLMRLGLSPDDQFVALIPQKQYRYVVAVPALMEKEVLFDQAYPEEEQGYGYRHVVFEPFAMHPDKNLRGNIIEYVMEYNKRSNMIMTLQEHWIKHSMFRDWLMEEGSLPKDPEAKQAWKQAGLQRLLTFSKSVRTPPRPVDPPNIVGLLAQDLTINIDMLNRELGYLQQLGGMKANRKDGAALYGQQITQAQLPVEPILQNAKRVFRQVLRLELAMTQLRMTERRWIRATGSDASFGENGFWVNDWDMNKGIPIRDVSIQKYDVRLDAGHLTEVQKQAKFQERLQVRQTFSPIFNDFTIPELLKLSGWPDAGALTQKWRAAILVQYAPYGQQILQMIDNPTEFEQAVQQGQIMPQELMAIRGMAMQNQPMQQNVTGLDENQQTTIMFPQDRSTMRLRELASTGIMEPRFTEDMAA